MSEKKYHILVVDDNRDSAESMAELLTISGFEVETCFDGPSALKVCEKFPPDACLLDINMPGMDGYELAQRLRERFADHPPVFATMTAYGDYAHLERAVDAGFDLQFTKPIESHEVIEQLEGSVRRAEHAEDDRSILRRLLSRVFRASGRSGRKKSKGTPVNRFHGVPSYCRCRTLTLVIVAH